MQNWEIIFTRRAYKEFLSLPLNYKFLVEREIKDLIEGKRIDIKKIKGERNIYRIRVGKYRILLKKLSQKKEIFVIGITHRRDTYK